MVLVSGWNGVKPKRIRTFLATDVRLFRHSGWISGAGWPAPSALLNKELKFSPSRSYSILSIPIRDRTEILHHPRSTLGCPHVQVKVDWRRSWLVLGLRNDCHRHFKDATGEMELVWFQGIKWAQEKLHPGVEYGYLRKAKSFLKFSIAHPEIEPVTTITPPMDIYNRIPINRKNSNRDTSTAKQFQNCYVNCLFGER